MLQPRRSLEAQLDAVVESTLVGARGDARCVLAGAEPRNIASACRTFLLLARWELAACRRRFSWRLLALLFERWLRFLRLPIPDEASLQSLLLPLVELLVSKWDALQPILSIFLMMVRCSCSAFASHLIILFRHVVPASMKNISIVCHNLRSKRQRQGLPQDLHLLLTWSCISEQVLCAWWADGLLARTHRHASSFRHFVHLLR